MGALTRPTEHTIIRQHTLSLKSSFRSAELCELLQVVEESVNCRLIPAPEPSPVWGWQNLSVWLGKNRGDLVIAGVAFVIAFGVYLRTLCPTVYAGDSAELTLAAYSLGIIHPPGHPTYLLIGKLFSLLPFGDVGYRLNLMSGFFAAATVTGVYVVCRQLLCSRIAAIAAALLLAFSYFFWSESLVAEVYSLNTTFFVVLLFLLLAWRKHRHEWLLLFSAFVYGLSLGSHTASSLFAPGLLAFLLLNRGTHAHKNLKLLRSLLRMLPAFLLGCAVFAYLPLRYQAEAPNFSGWLDVNQVYHTIDLASPQGLRWFMSGQMYEKMFFFYDLRGFIGEIGRYGGWLWQSFLGVGVLLGALGLLRPVKALRKEVLWLFLFFIFPLLFYLDYGAFDKEQMFLITYTAWSIWLAFGIDVIIDVLRHFSSAERLRALPFVPLAQVCLLVLPLLALAINFPTVDASTNTSASHRAKGMLQSVETNAVVMSNWIEIQPMRYYQQVEGVRPDVVMIDKSGLSPEDLVTLVKRNQKTSPVYVTDNDARLSASFNLRPLQPFEQMDVGYRLLSPLSSAY